MNTSWQERIAAIESAGITRGQIADHCGLPYSTLNDLALGRTKEPKGMAAVRLFALSETKKLPDGDAQDLSQDALPTLRGTDPDRRSAEKDRRDVPAKAA